MISYKFQVEPKSLGELLEGLSTEQMEELGARIFEANNIEDIEVWIDDMR